MHMHMHTHTPDSIRCVSRVYCIHCAYCACCACCAYCVRRRHSTLRARAVKVTRVEPKEELPKERHKERAEERAEEEGSASSSAAPATAHGNALKPWASEEPLPPVTQPMLVPPEVHDRVRVQWFVGSATGVYDGRVTALQRQLTARGAMDTRVQVLYDDTQLTWHTFSDSHFRFQLLASSYDVETGDWQELKLRCSISKDRLDDPAKGAWCRHPSCCNFHQLKQYVLRHKKCPVGGCGATMRRSHDVQRDDVLRKWLASCPDAESVWIRGGEIRAEGPHAE